MDTTNRTTLIRARFPQRPKHPLDERDPFSDLRETQSHVVSIRRAKAKVLRARADLTTAIADLESALHAVAPEAPARR